MIKYLDVRGVILAAVALGPMACAAAPDDLNGLDQADEALASATVVRLPVHVTLVSATTTLSTRSPVPLPSSLGGTTHDTVVTIDAELDRFNRKLAAAASAAGDARRVELVRVGFDIIRPTTANTTLVTGAQAVAAIGDGRRRGVLHLLISAGNTVTPPFWAWPALSVAVTNGGSLPHESGHLLDLRHTFDLNFRAANDTSTRDQRERLARVTDVTLTGSCYRSGDRVCDTPPDMGTARWTGLSSPVWNLDNVVCGTAGFLSCTQSTTTPCDSSDNVVDMRYLIDPVTGARRTDASGSLLRVCRSAGGGFYTRTYDPAALGVVMDGTPDNIMAYGTAPAESKHFTRGQFERAHGYARWALNEPDVVPAVERSRYYDLFGYADVVLGGGALPDRDRAWSHVITQDRTLTATTATSSSRTYTYTFTGGARGRARSVLDVSYRAGVTGSLRASMEVEIRTPRGDTLRVRPRFVDDTDSSVVADDSLVVTGGRAGRPGFWRGVRPQGAWTVVVRDTSGATLPSLTGARLRFNLSDRIPTQNDHRNDGLGSVIAWRPSTRQLWVSRNNGDATFAGGSSHGLPATAAVDCTRRLVAGDFDGDGMLDALCWTPAGDRPSRVLLGRTSLVSGVDASADRTIASTDEALSGDFNGDGFGDLLVRAGGTGSTWTLFRGLGDGRFTLATSETSASGGRLVFARPGGGTFGASATATWSVGDFDADGRADVMIRERDAATGLCRFYIAYNRATIGTVVFDALISASVAGSTTAYYITDEMTVFDVDGDGADDMIHRRPSTGQWWLSSKLTGASQRAAFAGGGVMQIGGSTSAYLGTDVIVGSSRRP